MLLLQAHGQTLSPPHVHTHEYMQRHTHIHAHEYTHRRQTSAYSIISCGVSQCTPRLRCPQPVRTPVSYAIAHAACAPALGAPRTPPLRATRPACTTLRAACSPSAGPGSA